MKLCYFAILNFLFIQSIFSQDCPPSFPGSSSPPSNVVQVEVLSVNPNSDMEGDDDFVPFYDNRADIYGTVKIGDTEFELPKKEDDDFPHWGEEGKFTMPAVGETILINISIKESDGGLTGDDDVMDINPMPGKSDLDLEFNLCSYIISGDVQSTSAIQVLTIQSGSGDSQGTIKLRIGTEDGRPSTSDDLALIDVQLIQVVYNADALVALKPTIVMARMANNYNTTINTTFNFNLSGSGMNINESVPVTLEAGEVKKQFFFTQNPIMIPQAAAGQGNIAYMASLVDPNAGGLSSDDCRAINDGNRNRHFQTVTKTNKQYKIQWAKVGTLLDGFNMTPDAHFDEIFDLGAPYIDAIYPISNIVHHQGNTAIIPPISGGLLAFLTTIISPFVPDITDPRMVEPYAMVMELDGMAILLDYDRLLGVLPSWDWFERYPHLEDLTGLSLGEFMPRAVIFEPKTENAGAAMTVPAHELGHTFGLSVDSRLKNSWVCAVDWPILGSAGCGLVGGFDEYKHKVDSLKNGNIASGYWITQGNIPFALQSLHDAEQCASNCMMGNSPSEAHLNWADNKRWIDNPDYNHLLRKTSIVPVQLSTSAYISGWIAHNDSVFIHNVFVKDEESAGDPIDTIGIYQLQFLDQSSRILHSVNLQLYWKYVNDEMIVPATPFSLKTNFPERSTSFSVVNRKSGKTIHTQSFSRRKPIFESVSIRKKCFSKNSVIKWKCSDADSDKLQYMVVKGNANENWLPVSYWDSSTKVSLDDLGKEYDRIKILARDESNLVESRIMIIKSRYRGVD